MVQPSIPIKKKTLKQGNETPTTYSTVEKVFKNLCDEVYRDVLFLT